MPLPLIPYERAKHIGINLAIFALVVLIAACSWLAIEGAGTLRAVKLQAQAAKGYDERIGRTLDGVNGVVSNLNSAAAHLNSISNTADANLPALLEGIRRNESGIQAELDSLRSATDEGRSMLAQAKETIKQNGDNLANLESDTNKSINGPGGLMPQIVVTAGRLSDASLAFKRASEGLPILIADADGSLKGLQSIELSADGAIRGLTPIEANLAGFTDELHGEAKDVHAFTHQKLFPGPVHGFWGHAKQVFEIVAGPVLNGLKTYYLINPAVPKVTVFPK